MNFPYKTNGLNEHLCHKYFKVSWATHLCRACHKQVDVPVGTRWRHEYNDTGDAGRLHRVRVEVELGAVYPGHVHGSIRMTIIKLYWHDKR